VLVHIAKGVRDLQERKNGREVEHRLIATTKPLRCPASEWQPIEHPTDRLFIGQKLEHIAEIKPLASVVRSHEHEDTAGRDVNGATIAHFQRGDGCLYRWLAARLAGKVAARYLLAEISGGPVVQLSTPA
jgi:hypothetical protein